MADVSYVPGRLTAVTGDNCWVLVDAPPDSPAVGWLWQQLGGPALPESLLAGLLGVRFAGATDFALLSAGDDETYRLFCRGAVTATVDEAGPVSGARIDGGGLLTWREHTVRGDARRIVLGSPPEGDALRLPATAGVLLAGCVLVELTAASVPQGPVLLADALDHGANALDHRANALDHRVNALDHRDALPAPVMPSRPELVPHPDTVTSGPRVGSEPEPAEVPDTITMTGPSSRAAPDEARAAGLLPAESPPVGAPPAGPPPGTGDEGYDFFWGATQARSVADAAIREAADGDAGHRPVFGEPGPLAGLAERSALSSPAGVPPLPALPGQSPHPAGSRGPESGPSGPGGLIDVPSWNLGPGPAPDHREETDFTIRRGALPGLARGAAPPPDKIGPAVPALVCPAGHANPPSEAVCRHCGAPLPADPVVVPRPVLGVLRLSVGDVIALDRGVVMGRAPRADAAGPDAVSGSAGEERPHVVKLPSADGDVSRTHLRVILDGWHVLVTDLNSTNGTLVTLPGREPLQLRPGEPMPIKPGTVVTLADGIEFRYEVSE